MTNDRTWVHAIIHDSIVPYSTRGVRAGGGGGGVGGLQPPPPNI